ncbi:MAG: YiiX/YebB-like N1pC/P60 family cysteine hydrolase [Ferruginibacter sp.]
MKAIFSFAVLLCLLFAACNSSETPASANELTPQQQINASIDSFKMNCSEGDLIVHLNDDLVSSVIKNMNEKDQSFSHSGILVIKYGQKMVCNIYPALHPNTSTDTIQYEPLDSFINPAHNLTAGLFRYDLSQTEKKTFLAELDTFKLKNPHFDERYDYTTDDKLYCSEMIAKALVKATNGRYSFKKILLSPQMVRLFRIYYRNKEYTEEFVKNMPYVSIDNLYSIPQCKEIMRIKLKYMP